MQIPFSEASERNKAPILEVMKTVITPNDRKLLEIGSGSGQHAIFMAPQFPFLEWWPSDRAQALLPLRNALANAKVKNIVEPTTLEIGQHEFPKVKFDLIFTANTFHIMNWKECKTLIKMMGNRLRENSRVMIYGPFKYKGEFTSESNAQFDQQLKESNALSGIRSFEDVNAAMIKNGFEFQKDHEMPANNRMLVYKRLKFEKS
jgi:cyclopropane fatty-acyl-phospholipid synthase-like methyltransferase